MAAADSSGAVGLVLARPARLLGAEPFFMEFIAGIEECLTERDMSVLLHVVTTHAAELAAYRRWAAGRLVDAVVLVNRSVVDPRPALLRELDMPVVVVGEPAAALGGPAVRTDDAGPVVEALRHLFELGHSRIARITGPAGLLHTAARTAAMLDGCRAAGAVPMILEGDYSEESGAKLTAALLGRSEPPTAILYDNDVMAVAGLGAAKELGVSVPGRLSLIAWDDSTLCRLASPSLTTMSVDVHQFGVSVAQSVLELTSGQQVAERWSPAATLLVRESSAIVAAH
ncbi:LacI family transcriptional regulator [Lentzea pudingi]|uniref:LacI family transcriptional regulator n=1 Tax=Lentzea pudingi TaxID=1789439 RepID=A0ABQ2HZ50_9PSEU|nr:substrate-binding domain-containing protein [Lentzea pudingi]GGM94021.1 LacI family transcriptional regulator [Lentzea pudingi]